MQRASGEEDGPSEFVFSKEDVEAKNLRIEQLKKECKSNHEKIMLQKMELYHLKNKIVVLKELNYSKS